jgi:adenosine 3'-phospho 5'-phosphosulfate transporter B3
MATEDAEKKTGLDALSPTQQFIILGTGVFCFFGTHNILQEAMMKIPGFEFGVMLGYMEVVGVCVCSYLERTFIAKETTRVAPLSAYPLLTFCLLSSSALSNLALNFINFPTKVGHSACHYDYTRMAHSHISLSNLLHRLCFGVASSYLR